jgi:hypothetical protein
MKMLAALIALLAVAAGPSSIAPPGAGVRLRIIGRANANVTVAAERLFVAVAWGASTESGATDVYAAVSRDGGRTFRTPVRVNQVPGDARLSGEQPAHVSLVPRAGTEPSIVVVWTSKGANGTRLLTARSEDGGASFRSASSVPGGDAAGNRGWEATAVDREGRVFALWLDHRELAPTTSAPEPMPHDHSSEHAAAGRTDGAIRAQASKLFVASLDGAVPAHAIAGGVCYCCKTALAVGADGSVYAAWRHVYPGDIRDIAFAVSRDGGRRFTEPARVSEDRWAINGCPEDGPALAVDARNRVHVVWPTVDGDSSPSLYYAVSPTGAVFTPRQRLPIDGTAKHLRIAIAADGSPIVVWDESAGAETRVVEARGVSDSSGAMHFVRAVLSDGQRAVYPAVARTSDGIVAAWMSGAGHDAVIRIVRR